MFRNASPGLHNSVAAPYFGGAQTMFRNASPGLHNSVAAPYFGHCHSSQVQAPMRDAEIISSKSALKTKIVTLAPNKPGKSRTLTPSRRARQLRPAAPTSVAVKNALVVRQGHPRRRVPPFLRRTSTAPAQANSQALLPRAGVPVCMCACVEHCRARDVGIGI